MTDEQLYLAIGLPMLFNAILAGLLISLVNAKIGAMGIKFGTLLEAVNRRLDAINQRFDDMRDLWRAELHRAEEVLDARLKHLEGR